MKTTWICDWCDAPAVVRHRETSEAACEEHRRELLRAIAARIALGGQPFAGEAAEAWITGVGPNENEEAWTRPAQEHP